MRCTSRTSALADALRSVLAITLVVGMLAPVLVGQAAGVQVPQHRLSDPDATFPEALSSINGLRELPDGRVMIADGLGQALIVANLESGRADTIGGVGGGPNEYRTPDAVFPLPGDSTLLVDLGNGRLTALGPDFSFGETMPLTLGQAGPGPGSMIILIPRAVDRDGRIYLQLRGEMGPDGPSDSSFVARYDRGTRRVDSLVQVRLPERTVSRSGPANARNVSIRQVPMSAQDGWAVAPDGRVALVRTDQYRVEWWDPNGGVVRGPAVDYRPLPVRDAEKQRWLANLGRGGLSVEVSIGDGQRRTSFSRGGGNSETPDPDSYEWPDVMPAFQADDITVDAAGDVWVGRYTRAGDAPRYDVFDGQGRLKAHITLPEGSEIAGFGNGVVYLVSYDEFDLQYLERYRITT